MLIAWTYFTHHEQIAEGNPPAELVKTAVLKNIKDFFFSILVGRLFYALLTLGKKKRDDAEETSANSAGVNSPADAVQTQKAKDAPAKGEHAAVKHEKIGWSNLRFTGPRGAVAISLFDCIRFILSA